MDFFVSNMLALNIVDSPSFVSLVKTLNPKKTVMSRRTLGRRIEDSHKELEQRVIKLLETVPWVATTADCWSAHHKSYLGMTAHWLDPVTRTREHAVLAFSRLRGHHTSDVLAQAMVGVHAKFNIQQKVTRTTTDNASNFVKAFVDYGAECGIVPDHPVVTSDDDDDEVAKDQETQLDENDDDVLQVVPVSEVLAVPSPDDADEYGLPKHMRCAAHTLNLVATADAGKAIKPQSPLRSAYRRAMSKAQSLFNLQNRSTPAADAIKKEIGRRLLVPNATRWNSTYDAVKVLNGLLDGGKRAALNKIMTQLKLQSLSDTDVAFLKEYEQVMASVAKALDVVQGENHAYLGCLLPTLAITVRRLRESKMKDLRFCEPLVDAILEGMERRFRNTFKDLDCQLAAAFHPMFRLTWLEQHDATQACSVRGAMESAVETALRELKDDATSTSSTSEPEDEEGDFFQGMTHCQKPETSRSSSRSKSKAVVKMWPEDVWKKEDGLSELAFRKEPALQQVFMKFNTGVPSSASVERMFSMGKDVLRAKRATLSDANLERLVFVKGNRHLAEHK